MAHSWCGAVVLWRYSLAAGLCNSSRLTSPLTLEDPEHGRLRDGEVVVVGDPRRDLAAAPLGRDPGHH